MPASRLRFAAVAGFLVPLQALAVAFSGKAAAAPDDDPCESVPGPARDYCESGDGSGGAGGGSGGGPSDPESPLSTLDPLTSLAKGCAKAAAWTVDKLSDLVNDTTKVDFTNPEFLRQYAVVFAASTVLTLTLWLLAVAKRAVRGVPLTQALSEAIGFLWLTVIASAFTPLILYTVVSATDAVTDVIASGTTDKTDQFFGTFSKALEKGENIGGGPIMLIVVSLISVLAAGVLYLELVIRAALLYVGALLGTAVYAGLVDKNLWGHVRRWAGIMIAVILVKPVIVIVLGLAGALSGSEGPDSFSAIVSGLAIILLAIFASAMIYRFVPGFGDEIVNQRNASSDPASRAGAAIVSSPASLVRQGINTHGGRGGGGGGGGAAPAGGGEAASAKPSNPVSGGVAAHGSRGGAPPEPPRKEPPRRAAPPPDNSRTARSNSPGER
ncbi:hypothetical protein [Streptomyces sulphureus]|uniref:hypothetical protein n=1 Tax=Streptomyces sulphureus TaxID=47758 RepID=UPI00036A3843|nr:hypothetical protein [Streptomyces sulphureus]